MRSRRRIGGKGKGGEVRGGGGKGRREAAA